MNNQIQLVLKSSTAEMPLNDHELGIYLVPELDGLVGLPEIRTTSGVNAGYDGGWTSAQNYDARSITIRGVIANQDVATVERLRKQLVSLAGQGKKEELTLGLVTEAGNAYTLQVRTIALDMAMKSVLEKQEFMLQLRADDPLIYDASESAHEAFIQVSKATGGFLIDFELPLAITGGSDEAAVENNGFEQVPTVTKMYGALHNPKLINQTTNQFMQIEADLGFSEGQWVDPSEPVEGKSITINGAPADAPFADIQLKGDTSQAGTPTPSAPVVVKTVTGENVVKIHGKNLLELEPTTFDASGVTVTVDSDGTITFDGTATAGYNQSNEIRVSSTPKVEVGETVTYSYHYVSGTVDSEASTAINLRSGLTTTDYQFQFNSSYIRLNSQDNSTTITAVDTGSTKQAGYITHVQIFFPSGRVFNNLKTKLQLEVGSTATDYEPYQGQSYEVNLGKNLFDKNNANLVDGQITSSKTLDTSAGKTLYIPCEPNTTYTVQKKTSSRSRLGTSQEIMTTSNSLTNYTQTITDLGDGLWKLTITSGPNDKYLYVTYAIASDDFLTIRAGIQVEKGSQATSYAAYFTPIELCKIGNYQDYIYKSGDKWYVRKEVGKATFTGEAGENWTRESGNRMDITIPSAVLGSSSNNPVFANMYQAAWAVTNGKIFLSGAYNGIGLCDNTNGTSVANYKTFLSSNPLVVYYALATPTDTEITNAALVAQLEELLNNASMYNPQTNISSQFAVGNEQGELAVSYYTNKTPDIRDELIIDSRLRTITLNGVDVYHLKTAGSEFIMLAPGENRLSLESDIPGDNGYAQVSYKQGYLSI